MMESVNNALRILVMGVTSYDNQGVVNEVMGKTVYPDIRSTTEFQQHDLVDGYYMKRFLLTVAPGFMDSRPNMPPAQMKREILCELKKSKYKEGFDGVLMVMRYPFRWTDEERNTVQYALDIVKRSNLEKYGYLILTNGHNFKFKYPNDTEREFADYLYRQGQQEPELKKFLDIFQGKILILDTELDDAQWNGNQVARLFESMLCSSGPPFNPTKGSHFWKVVLACSVFASISCWWYYFVYRPGGRWL